jgi:hypothetical protein
MAKTFKSGDKVSWHSSQGEIHGEVVRKVTKNTSIKGNDVKASQDEPQYEVKSDETGAHAFHKPEALKHR